MKLLLIALLTCLTANLAVAQTTNKPDEKAEAVIAKAVRTLGGERYLQVKTQIGRGRFSSLKDGSVIGTQTFIDVIVYPDTERTEFKSKGSRTVQANSGGTGWVYDGDQDVIKVQNDGQLANFKRGLRTSLDHFLRGSWRGEGQLVHAGRRPATLGKRNDVLKLTYADGLVVEFEFADDGTPQKAIYRSAGPDGEFVTDEDRYAQFIDIDGVKIPFIVDRFTDGTPISRINYESVELNKNISPSWFTKPSSNKDAKKEFKL